MMDGNCHNHGHGMANDGNIKDDGGNDRNNYTDDDGDDYGYH